jgi:hypothetical protein
MSVGLATALIGRPMAMAGSEAGKGQRAKDATNKHAQPRSSFKIVRYYSSPKGQILE